MGPVAARIAIDVPRERVFELVGDLANRPAFLGSFVDEYRLQRLEAAGVGAAARFRLRERKLWMETVIVAVEPPHLIREQGRAGRLGRIPVFTVWELTEAGASGTDVKVTFWSEPSHPADRIRDLLPRAERYHRRGWQGALGRLRDLLEQERTVERVSVGGGDRIPGAG